MTQPQTVTVRIMDKDYHIACPASESANLERAAEYLDKKMRDIRRTGKVVGAERIAVMAALNITHDLLHKQELPPAKAQANGANSEQVRDLLDRVDLVLATDSDKAQG